MSITLATGTSIYFASGYGAAKTFSAASNAAETELSFAADPSLAENDIVEMTSGWEGLDDRVVRVDSVSGAGPYLAVLEDVNTSDTNDYPAGSGTGSVREISGWTEITQVKDFSMSGGEMQFADISTVKNRIDKKMPTTRSALDMTINAYEDASLSWVASLRTYSEARTPVAVKFVFPNDSVLYANAYVSLREVPNIARNEALTIQITLSFAADPIKYAS